MKLPCFLLALTTTAGFAQGPLAPSAAPAPTQKSLQEIWDKLSTQQAQITSLQTQLTAVSGLNAVSAAGLALPWNISTVDSVGNVGHYASLAFGPDGQPAIAYQNWDNINYKYLRFSKFNGKTWTLSSPESGSDIFSSNNPLAFSPDGQPAVAYSMTNLRGMHFTPFNGTAWTPTLVEPGSYFAFSSLEFGPDGQPAISFANQGFSGLKFARFNGTAWTTTGVDSVNISGSSLAFGPDGQPAIAYQDSTLGKLKFARFNSTTGWVHTIVPVTGTVGVSASLAFGPDGQPSIAYHDFTDTAVKFIRFNGTSWPSSAEIIDTDKTPGEYTSLAYGPDGQPSVAYYEVVDGDLKFARYNGSSWDKTIVDTVGDVGKDASLAFGPDGQPAIAYRDKIGETNHNLKFARKGLFPTRP